MIVSHETSAAYLWRAKTFSWSSEDWELVSDDYQIGGCYEYIQDGDIAYIPELSRYVMVANMKESMAIPGIRKVALTALIWRKMRPEWSGFSIRKRSCPEKSIDRRTRAMNSLSEKLLQ